MTSLASSLKRYTASGDLQRKSRSTTVGGFTGVDINNKYINYEQMSLMSPHIFVPLHKTALTICKDYHFESASGNAEKVKEYEAWAKRVNLNSKIRTLVRLSCRNGTYVARWENENNKSQPEFMSFEPLMMEKTTIIPEGFNPDDAKNDGELILTTPIAQFWVNEGSSKKNLIKKYKPEEVVYIALYPYDYRQKDIKNRETYGIYGISLMESIVDIFNKYMDVIEGFATYVKKYGQGRYHINYKILEDMIIDGNVEEALKTLELFKAEHETISANDDIVSAGCEIKGLDTGGGSLSVTDFKRSLENDIEIGLMQSPITMGKGEGSTYASGYVAESDRLLTLEGLQQEFEAMINDQIIKYRELNMNPGSELTWQDDIYLKFEQISELNLPLADIIQALINDMITIDEGRDFIDLKPAEEEINNGMNPAKLQAEQAKAQLEMQEKTATMQMQATKIQAQAVKSQGRPEVGGKSNTQKNTEKSQKTAEKKASSLKL